MKNAFIILALLVQLGCAESSAHKAIQDEKSEVGNKIAEKKFYFSAVAEKYEIGYVDKKMDVNMIAITLKQPTMIRFFGDSLRILNVKANFYMVDDSVVNLPNGEGIRVRFISKDKKERPIVNDVCLFENPDRIVWNQNVFPYEGESTSVFIFSEFSQIIQQPEWR